MPTGVYVRTEKTRESLRQAKLGTTRTQETKDKISRTCKAKRIKPPLWIGKRGKFSKEHIAKLRKCRKVFGKEHGNWKGNSASYFSLHIWVNRWKGKPQYCIMCRTKDKKRRYYWANKDHKYRRVLDDYISLCASCHKKYDKEQNNPKLILWKTT